MKKALLTFAAFLSPVLALAEDTTPAYDPWYQVIIDAITAAWNWIINLCLNVVGTIFQTLFNKLPTDLQTGITPYLDYISILNAWIPLGEATTLFMMWLSWSGIYSGVRWAVRIIRGA